MEASEHGGTLASVSGFSNLELCLLGGRVLNFSFLRKSKETLNELISEESELVSRA